MSRKVVSGITLTLLSIMLNIASTGWFGTTHAMTQLDQHVIVNTGADGLYPSVYENLILFPTGESRCHIDLNNDGDMDDSIIRYYDISTQTLTNTAIEGSHPAIYGNIAVFTFRPYGPIKYYDLSTQTTTPVGAIGNRATIHGDIIAFEDTSNRIRYYDVSTGALENTFAIGIHPSVYGSTIAFCTPERWIGVDLNGDGDLDDEGVRFYDITTHRLTDLRVTGGGVSTYGDVISFETSESSAGIDLNGDDDQNDIVIRYYEVSTGTLVNTGICGRALSLYGNLLAFYHYNRIYYYYISTGRLVDTGVMGSYPSAYRNTIAFYTSEKDEGEDLNGDGDREDFIIRYLKLPVVPATVDISPDTLNTWSLFGKFITAYIELPEGYNANDIDISTVKLNGEVQAELHPTKIGDYDNDGTPDLMVKFYRANVVRSILRTGDDEITIRGMVFGKSFEGSYTIRVIT